MKTLKITHSNINTQNVMTSPLLLQPPTTANFNQLLPKREPWGVAHVPQLKFGGG
jgi:hypothetical protein